MRSTTTTLPPEAYWIWLSQVPGIGPAIFHDLIERVGPPEKIYFSTTKDLEACQCSASLIATLCEFRSLHCPEELYRPIAASSMRVALSIDSNYPNLLRQTPSHPPVLYYYGSLKSLQSLCVTVVGSRAHSTYGKQAVVHIIPELITAGVTIVSGLALGIDTLAHRCAVQQQRPTVAFLGSGLDQISPRSNTALARDIVAAGGAVVSEFYPGTLAFPKHFPRRNRLLAGVSRATVLIEANQRSGSLITASYATEFNRDVFVVPGSIFSNLSLGVNSLLQQGAYPITQAADLLQHYHLTTQPRAVLPASLSLEQQKVLAALQAGPLHIDKIARITTLDISAVHATVSLLELDGLVRNLDAHTYCKTF